MLLVIIANAVVNERQRERAEVRRAGLFKAVLLNVEVIKEQVLLQVQLFGWQESGYVCFVIHLFVLRFGSR